jgi:hypothetical protein
MLANFLKKSSAANFVVLGLFFLCFAFFSAFKFPVSGFGLTGIWSYVVFSISLLGILLSFYLILKENSFSRVSSFVFYFTLIFWFLFPGLLNDLNVLVSFLCVLQVVRKTWVLSRSNKPIKLAFDSGIWLGISVICVPESLVYFLFITGALIYRKSDIRVFLSVVFSLGSVFFCYFAFTFYLDDLSSFLSMFSYELSPRNWIGNSFKTYFYICLASIWVFSTLFFLKKSKAPILKTSKNLFTFCVWQIGFGIFMLFAFAVNSSSLFLYLCLPFGVFSAFTVISMESEWFQNIVLWFFFILPIISFLL